MLLLVISVLISSYLVCLVVCPVLARVGVVDVPNERSSHKDVTIRGGGVAIILCIVGAFLIERMMVGDLNVFWILLIVAVLAGVSFVDDVRSIGSGKRIIVHFGAAVAALVVTGLFGKAVSIPELGGVVIPGLVSGLFFVVWIAGYTNAFNFMDGINGLASLQGGITAWAACLVATKSGVSADHWAVSLSFCIGASCLGFVPHNFPHARMFMGDVGSAPLGMLLALTVIGLGHASDWRLLIPLVLLHANFVLDTGITLVRRILKGEKWYAAHRSHFYQKLQRSGKSHSFVTSMQMALQLLVVGLIWFYSGSDLAGPAILMGGVLAIWFGFYCYCEREFRLYQANLQ